LKEAIISICAMLNQHGKGTVYFGINDDGTVAGQHIGKSTIKDISKAIGDHLEPKIFPEIVKQNIAGKECIVVNFSGHDNLYAAYGRFYLRVGEEDKKLSVSELRRLVEKRNHYVYSWGAEVSETPIAKADVSTIREFVKRGQEAGRISFSFDSTKNVLQKLNLVKGTKLLNAGRALFCKGNRVEVQTAVFAGKDKITFLDIQSFKGTLFDLIEKSEIYVKEHINWRADLSGSKRIEIPEIPVRAIKEAIINSLCHRDFTNPKSNEIAIYRDRIEIFNPGQFPYEYSPEDFIKGTEASLPRNPLVAETLFRSEDVEKWGSGLRRISQECQATGVRVIFGKTKSGFTVTFFRPQAVVAGGTARREGPEKITENQRLIIKSMKQNQYIVITELAAIVGISERKVKENIAKLKVKGLLRRIGPDKGGYWEIVK
jgi:ATP-dependent DNA helicase RecG